MFLLSLLKQGFEQTTKGVAYLDEKLENVEKKCLGGKSIDQHLDSAWGTSTSYVTEKTSTLRENSKLRKVAKAQATLNRLQEQEENRNNAN